MFVKGISTKYFPKNCLGELSNSSSRRWTHNCFGEISSNSPRRVVQCIYPNSVVSFREKKTFVLKTDYFTHIRLRCDAPKPGGPLTTRQPAEYKWMSGYPTPLQKIGQSLLCTGSSTQLQNLHILSQTIQYMQYISNISNHMSYTAPWAHKQYSIYIPTMNPTIYPIVTRVQMFYSYTAYIKMKSILIHVYNVTPKPQPRFLLKHPHVRTVSSHAPFTCKKGVPRRGELKLSRRIALSGLLTPKCSAMFQSKHTFKQMHDPT